MGRLLSLIFLLLATAAHARPLQILHTNDLHSHFAGYPALKSAIDRLKAEAAAKGIESLVLDAGDFSEGSRYYLSSKGVDSWSILNGMGYDAVALGNHDYLTGQKELDFTVGLANPTYPVVAANFRVQSGREHLKKHILPYVTLQRAGLRIAVLGLTTNAFVFRWRAGREAIFAPSDAAKNWLPKLRKNHDFVIGLTHLGYRDDRALVRKVKGFDLIVGGHTHTPLFEPLKVQDPSGRTVPIVQAGEHAEMIGRLVLDVEPGKEPRILSYELLPIEPTEPKDPVMAERVAQADRSLEAELGAGWLSEVIGHSEVPLIRPKQGRTIWGDFIGEAMRVSASADVVLDAGADLFGTNQPEGPVTRGKLYDFYPRVFTFNTNKAPGWTIWKVRLKGWFLQALIARALTDGWVASLTGGSYDIVYDENERPKPQNIRIGGVPLVSDRAYMVAVPEGIGRAMLHMPILFRLFLFRKVEDTGVPVITAVEQRLRTVKTVR